MINFRRKNRLVLIVTLSTFLVTGVFSNISFAQSELNLPAPGTELHLSSAFNPPIIKGITIYPNNPLQFDFIINQGDQNLTLQQLRQEGLKMVKYFMASMTIPNKEMWVNLSPIEKNRIVGESLGRTEMGRDLLAEDYMLKQLSASMMDPDSDIGKKFWDKVYKQARAKFGTTDVPVNTFNKVWIVPDKAVVVEAKQSAFVAERHLKVMLEEDYLLLARHNRAMSTNTSSLGSHFIRQIIIPALEKEVNEGTTFATVRQVYNAMILATWYKQNLKETLLAKVYADKNKTRGVDIDDKQFAQRIYEQYLRAFKKGVVNFIREEPLMSFPNASVGSSYRTLADARNPEHATITRKYFSGGLVGVTEVGRAQLSELTSQQRAFIEQGAGHNFAMTVSDVEVGSSVDPRVQAQEGGVNQEPVSDEGISLDTGEGNSPSRDGSSRADRERKIEGNEKLVIEPQRVLRGIAASVSRDLDKMHYPGWKHSEIEFKHPPIVNVDLKDLPYPDGVNVGLSIEGIPGMEACAFWAAKNRIQGVNFLFFSPINGIFFGKNHPDMAFVRYAVFLNKEGKIILGRFNHPIPVHAFDHGGLTGSKIKELLDAKRIPLLNPPGTISFAQDKIKFGLFLKEIGALTPDFEIIEGPIEEPEVKNKILHFMAEKMGARQEVVLKPSDGSFGVGVRFFSSGQIDEAVKHAIELLNKNKKVLIQPRIRNAFWHDATGHVIDWNLRVLTTWDGEDVVINKDMIEVRYQVLNGKPVNKTQGAKVILLEDFFKEMDFSIEEQKRYLDSIKSTLDPVVRAFENRLRSQDNAGGNSSHQRKETGLLGFDLIQDEQKQWNILEVNAGSVGGVETMETVAPDDQKGNTVMPIAQYLTSLARKYRDWHSKVITDEEGESLDLISEDVTSLFNFGEILRASQDYESARKLFERAWELDPQHFFVNSRLGLTHFESQDYELAREFLERAVELDPRNLEANLYLGAAYAESQDHELAREFFERALELDPRNLEANINLGIGHIFTEEFALAERYIRKAIVIDGKTKIAWTLLGIILLKEGSLNEAKESLEKGLDPSDVTWLNAWEDLINQYINVEEFELAQQALRKVMEANQSDLWESMLISVLIKKKEFSKAREEIEKAVTIHPEKKRYFRSLYVQGAKERGEDDGNAAMMADQRTLKQVSALTSDGAMTSRLAKFAGILGIVASQLCTGLGCGVATTASLDKPPEAASPTATDAGTKLFPDADIPLDTGTGSRPDTGVQTSLDAGTAHSFKPSIELSYDVRYRELIFGNASLDFSIHPSTDLGRYLEDRVLEIEFSRDVFPSGTPHESFIAGFVSLPDSQAALVFHFQRLHNGNFGLAIPLEIFKDTRLNTNSLDTFSVQTGHDVLGQSAAFLNSLLGGSGAPQNITISDPSKITRASLVDNEYYRGRGNFLYLILTKDNLGFGFVNHDVHEHNYDQAMMGSDAAMRGRENNTLSIGQEINETEIESLLGEYKGLVPRAVKVAGNYELVTLIRRKYAKGELLTIGIGPDDTPRKILYIGKNIHQINRIIETFKEKIKLSDREGKYKEAIESKTPYHAVMSQARKDFDASIQELREKNLIDKDIVVTADFSRQAVRGRVLQAIAAEKDLPMAQLTDLDEGKITIEKIGITELEWKSLLDEIAGHFNIKLTSAMRKKLPVSSTLGALTDELFKTAGQAQRGARHDSAMVVNEERYGGINFNPELLNLQIKRDKNGIALPISQQPIASMKIDGFIPIIIQIKTINLQTLLA